MTAQDKRAKAHSCDDRCICPIHGTPLLYSANKDDHACQDVHCKHGHGGLTPGLDPSWTDPSFRR